MKNYYLEQIDPKEIKDKRVIIRVDYNVPIKNEKVLGSFRIKASLKTIDFVLKNGAKEIILITHLGRPSFVKTSEGKPEGKVDGKLSLKPVAEKLVGILNHELGIGNSSQQVRTIKIGNFDAYQITEKIKLLENIRFFPEEEIADEIFSDKLSKLGGVFIFEAFGVANDEAASTTGIAKILPTYLGFNIKKEIDNLNEIITNHESPFLVVLGGAKVSDKLPVVKNLIKQVDCFLIGGAIANTFLAAKDKEVGKSNIELDFLEEALNTTNRVLSSGNKDIYLPMDFVTSKSLEKPVSVAIKNRQTIELDDYIVDIGPLTLSLMTRQIAEAKTIFWNGNMGISEIKDFENGTKEIAQTILFSEAKKIVAGGDTVAYLEKNGFLEKFDQDGSFISCGGGATLSYLAGEKMPILEILQK
jgi:phosphoglycerate kinase